MPLGNEKPNAGSGHGMNVDAEVQGMEWGGSLLNMAEQRCRYRQRVSATDSATANPSLSNLHIEEVQ